MIELKKYKHVIWDWNGTLLNDVELCCSIMNNLLAVREMKLITLQEYKEVFTFPVKEYYKRVGHDISDENWEILSYEFIDEYEERKGECMLYENAVKVLDKIEKLGISQSVLSAYSQNTLEELITKFGLRKYFIKLVGLDNIYAESKLENGIRWMNELGYNKGEVLLIGDTVHDYEVANAIGAESLLIAEGHQANSKLMECSSNLIDSLNELLI
ncbi:MAG: HAD family hydrolase [Melioribacteraceae bacterium]|nr:HAD family hydrolase [Melioribacteraceae bacterium]